MREESVAAVAAALALALAGCAAPAEHKITPAPDLISETLVAGTERSACDLHGVLQFPSEPGGLWFIACIQS